jgi:hypothetical protein
MSSEIEMCIHAKKYLVLLVLHGSMNLYFTELAQLYVIVDTQSNKLNAHLRSIST